MPAASRSGSLLGRLWSYAPFVRRRLMQGAGGPGRAGAEAEWLASFPDGNPNPVLEFDVATSSVVYMNRAAKEQFPDLATRGGGHPLLADLPAAVAALGDDPLEVYRTELPVNGSWYRLHISRVPDSQHVRIYGTDLTERKKAEQALSEARDALELRVQERTAELRETLEALRRSSAYNRSLIEASLDPLVTISADGKVTDVNAATEKITGLSRQALIGTDFSDYFTEPDKAREGYQHVFREGWVQDYALEVRHRDGHHTPVLYNASVYRDAHGQVLGVFAAARDITERKKAEEALRLASAYNRSLIEASLDPLVTIDADGRIMDVNAAAEKVTGRRREELVGTDFSEYFTEPTKARAGYQQVFREGAIQDYALEVRHRDGHHTPVLYNASVYRDPAGRVLGVFAAARDVTERRRAEEKLHQLNEELERRVLARTTELAASNRELEAFAYSVSHDLRAPLRAMDGFSQALLEDYAARLDENGADYLRRIRAASQRMAELIDGVLSLSRTTRCEMRRARVDLSAIAHVIARELARSDPSRNVVFEIAPQLVVDGDPSLLGSVLRNLLDNAWKFTGRQDPTRIEFGVLRDGAEPVYFVRDDGAGFDMAYADKLFGVFQRLHTTAEFEGTGVGLAAVQRVIHRHGGRVWAEAEVGKGATFYFTLPSEPRRS